MAILTISSEFGSGALEIGHAIERRLGYEYVPLRRIQEEAKESCVPLKRAYDESEPTSGLTREFLAYSALVQDTILGYALKDNVVILARGGNFLMKNIPHALRIRVVSPLENRIDLIAKKDGVSREAARLLVKQADREIDCTIQLTYGKTWDDPSAYELKFDTSVQPIDQIVDGLEGILKVKDSLKTPEAEVLLRRRAAATRIKSRMMIQPSFIIATLDLKIGEKGILVKGAFGSKAEQKRVEKEIREVAGDIPVRCQLHHEATK